MPRAMALVALIATVGTVSAEGRKFVGTWHGISNAIVYTKIVVHDEKNITYCYVQSCRQQACWDWTIEGSTNGAFAYENVSGRWEFKRIDADSIEGAFTNAAGETSLAFYDPE